MVLNIALGIVLASIIISCLPLILLVAVYAIPVILVIGFIFCMIVYFGALPGILSIVAVCWFLSSLKS